MDRSAFVYEREDRARRLGAFVRQRRQALGLTQSELAARCGWTQERISALETGRYGLPSVLGFAVLAEGLEVGLGEMMAASGFALERGP